MPRGTDFVRTVTVRRGQPVVFGLRSHIVLIETKDTQSSSSTDFTIEGTAAFGMLAIADIVLLAVSGRFSTVPTIRRRHLAVACNRSPAAALDR